MIIDEGGQAARRAVDIGAFLPCLDRVKQRDAMLRFHRLIGHRDKVSHRLAVLVINTPDLFQAGDRHLLRRFGQLHLGGIAAIVLFHGGQLVHAAEHGVALCGDHILADAETVHAGTLQDQVADDVLIQRVRRADRAVGVAGLIKHLAGLLGQVGDVAGVDADALGALAHRLEHLVKDLDRIGHAVAQYIVGVHQQHAGIGVQLSVFFEGIILGREHLDPTVRHRAGGRDAEVARRHDAGGGAAAADVGGARAEVGSVIALGAACAELHDRAAGSGADDAAGLGGNQALMVEGDEQQRFQQLALDGRALDRDNRLLREDRHALLNGPDVAVQLEAGQIVQKLFIKGLGGAQVGDVLVGKFQMIHRVNELLQTGHDGVAAAVRHAAEEHIKDGDLIDIALVQIACRHGKLIKIGHGGQIALYIQHGKNLH